MGSRNWSAVGAGVAILAAVVVALTSLSGRAAPSPAGDAKAEPKAATPFAAQLAGRASCSGRACHAGLEPNPSGVRQNEFTTWIAHDKHARAFDVLTQERGQRIAKNLGIASAEKDARCLACHTTPQLAGPVTEEMAALRSDGVGCEACHGPARGADPWLAAHVMADWQKLEGKAKADAYQQHGMTPLFDLEVQARTCAGCHVGAPADPEHGIPARDLNHDLMAAGHPRLTFELGTFRANLPPHWRADLHAATPGYEASVWAVGQAASAKASAELSAHRAKEAAAGKAPWPEFAEAGCFACHADLQTPSWRRHNTSYYAGRTPGAIPANRWYSALVPALETVAPGKAAPADKALKALAAELNKPYPDPAKVETLAASARADVAALLAAVKTATFDAAAVKALADGLVRHADTVKQPSWDEATQAALAATALREAVGKASTPEQQRPADDLFRALAYPPPYESPEGYSPRAKADGQGEDLWSRLLKLLNDTAH